ncbi:helicase ARIP4-like isoform X1 [Thraustotheca clavata]|uniref:Helicase ARIP4-like isoform X1 n=1 Tax=Thraustotheca clavata TaxID=74557 RepID=A0A1V9ZZ96_9STRA|nr:helicase ARIP4-like isoform X1 [Thraustotheca clavata]
MDECTCGFLPCVCVTAEEAEQAKKLSELRSILKATSGPCDSCLMLPCICEEDLYEEAEVPVVEATFEPTNMDEYGRVPMPGNEQWMVANEIATVLKPHQVDGVCFMMDQISKDQGCILADYMGLGKTLQLISVLHSFLVDGYVNNEKRTVLVICPTVCIMNWILEFRKWLKSSSLEYCPIYQMDNASNKANLDSRIETLEQWQSSGGVLVLGYEMYRLLLNPARKAGEFVLEATTKLSKGTIEYGDRKELTLERQLRLIRSLLCNPGPSLVALDEGHRIKDPTSILCSSLEQIATKKRIVLTGYPLQNSLAEYWCMVNFARPGFLENYETFRANYEKPIVDGDAEKATELTTRLTEVVLRRGRALLDSQLPLKHEWIVHCNLSPLQHELYTSFLDRERESKQQWDLFTAYTTLLQVVNHPDVVYSRLFTDNEEESSPNEDIIENDWAPVLTKKAKVQKKRKRIERDPKTTQWASTLQDESYTIGNAQQSGKMVVLLALLEESQRLGDKVVIFSQSVTTLQQISQFLDKRDEAAQPIKKGKKRVPKRPKTWRLLDGSVSSTKRMEFIEQFSKAKSGVDVFLVSTRAGAEGINLHAANRLVLFDVSWNPSHDHQSMCRSHRIGQTKDVHVYRFVSHDTIEERVYDQQVKKVALSSNVVDATTQGLRATGTSSSFFAPPIAPELVERYYEACNDQVLDACLKSAGQWIVKCFRAAESTQD